MGIPSADQYSAELCDKNSAVYIVVTERGAFIQPCSGISSSRYKLTQLFPTLSGNSVNGKRDGQ